MRSVRLVTTFASSLWLGLIIMPSTFAEDSSVAAEKRPPIVRNHTIEVNPLSFVVNVLPGVKGGEISTESAIQDNAAVYLSLGYLGAVVSDSDLQKAQEKSSDPLPNQLAAATGAVGYRGYFTSAHSDSGYWQAQTRAVRNNATWVYGDEHIKEHSTAVEPGLSAGYRWVWDNGFLIRLGIGVAYMAYTDRSLTSNATAAVMPIAATAGEDKVKSIEDKNQWMPAGDLGIGFAF